MIQLTRFSGSRFMLNSDLIERVDATPDTVITLSSGTKYLVSESLDEILDAILEFRSQMMARANAFNDVLRPSFPTPHLTSVTSIDDARKAEDHTTDGQDL